MSSRFRACAIVLALLAVPLAGCVGGGDQLEPASDDDAEEASEVDYEPPERTPGIDLVEESELVDVDVGEDVEIHVRIVRPDTDEPVPVIAEFTPYNAPGRAMLIEPMVSDPQGTYVEQFVERGFAFAFADVRGTSDSGGCLDLRGSVDVEDAGDVTEFLGTRDWSNGNVGFIGASYPGSEAHIAAIANDEHLGGVIPLVASTSFYGWHHKMGVPYSHHTTAFYYQQDATPSANPQHDNWLSKEAHQASECEQETRLQNGLDETGTYDDWWRDRDLNHRIDEIEVPVLMAQGLADWNVKPDHIDPWFNELDVNKTLIAGQWGHAYPQDAEEAYGEWWSFAAAFFDETLDGAETGMFDGDRAYVQDDDETWHTYEDAWPPEQAPTMTVNLTADGLSFDEAPQGEVAWEAPPEGEEDMASGPTEVVLESPPLEEGFTLSGTPTLNLTVTTEADHVHLVAILEAGSGDDWVRENYGYLNPTYRHGLDKPERVVPGEPTPVTIEMYPQEDVFEEGERLRLTLASEDDGATFESYEPGEVTATLGGEHPAQLELPLSPLES